MGSPTLTGANTRSVNATDLDPQTAYWLRLTYTDAAGATVTSVPVRATTLAPEPVGDTILEVWA